MARAQKKTAMELLTEAFQNVSALTAPSDWDVLANRKAPKNKAQVAKSRSLISLVETRSAEWDKAIAGFARQWDKMLADRRKADSHVNTERNRIVRFELSDEGNAIVNEIKKFGEGKGQSSYDYFVKQGVSLPDFATLLGYALGDE